MGLEEVARQSPPSIGSPDTGMSLIIFRREYLVNEMVNVAENCNFISREHESRGGGTSKPTFSRFS